MEDIANKKEKTAYDEYKKCINLIHAQSNLFLELGLTLKNIRDNKLFKYMGDGGFETWGRFLAQPEIGIKPSTARFYISIFEEYINRLGLEHDYIASRPFYKLQKLLPVVKKLELVEARTVIEETIELGANDFNAEMNKLKGVPEGGDNPPRVKRCEVCNKWVLIIPKDELCLCQTP